MNQGMVFVWESKERLLEMISKESDANKLRRLQLLYLLATREARTRKRASQLLGVHRKTVGYWIKAYESGGLEGLLEIKQSTGMVSSLPEEVIEAMRAKLSEPTGVASFKALQHWVEESFKIVTSYRVIHYTAEKVLGARLAVGRRSHLKKKKETNQLFERVLRHVFAWPPSPKPLFIGGYRWCYQRLNLEVMVCL